MGRVHGWLGLLGIVTAVAVLGSRAGPRDDEAPKDSHPVQAPPSNAPLVGELTLELDKTSYTQSEEITGRITFRVEWRDKRIGAGRTRVWLGDPRVSIVMDESVAIEVMTDTKLVDPVWIGHTYRFSFVVRASGPIQSYADDAGLRLRLARGGNRRIAASVTPTIHWWAGIIPRHDVFLSLASEGRSFSLTPGAGSLVEKEDVLSWIVSPLSTLDRTGYYMDPHQTLFAYYQFWKYPLRDLPLFKPPESVVELETCGRPPCFLLVPAGQEYTVRFADGQQHNLFDGHSYTPLQPNEGLLKAPAWEGLFPIECKVHSHRVGWLLIATWASDTSGSHGH